MNKVSTKGKAFLWAKTLFLDFLFLGLLCYGLFFGSEGAMNAVKFLVWVGFFTAIILGFWANSDAAKKDFLEDPHPNIPPLWWHYTTDLAAIIPLAWFGYFTLAGLKMVSMVFFAVFFVARNKGYMESLEKKEVKCPEAS